MLPTTSDPQFAFVDCEMTGLDAEIHEIIEVTVKTDKGGFTARILPEQDPCDDVIRLTGYNREEWQRTSFPKEEVARRILRYVKRHHLVGHHIEFDRKFLDKLFHEVGMYDQWKNAIRTPCICTVQLAFEHLKPHQITSCRLSEVCKFLRIPLNNQHTSFGDVEATEKVFQALFRPSLAQKARFVWLAARYRCAI